MEKPGEFTTKVGQFNFNIYVKSARQLNPIQKRMWDQANENLIGALRSEFNRLATNLNGASPTPMFIDITE